MAGSKKNRRLVGYDSVISSALPVFAVKEARKAGAEVGSAGRNMNCAGLGSKRRHAAVVTLTKIQGRPRFWILEQPTHCRGHRSFVLPVTLA